MVEDKNTKLKEKKTEEKVENKTEDKKEVKKVEKKEVAKKEVAFANGYSLKISPKKSKYICRMIRGKSPEAAIVRLQEVIDGKRPVPMAGLETAHKKGKGLAGAKFPKGVCTIIMAIVKQVGANANVVGIENPIITIAMSNQASLPYRRAGQKAKRTHIYLEVRDKSKLAEKKK